VTCVKDVKPAQWRTGGVFVEHVEVLNICKRAVGVANGRCLCAEADGKRKLKDRVQMHIAAGLAC